jgi:hypothetical protein
MDNIQTVAKHSLGSLIAYLSSERMEEVNQAIAFALGLDAPTRGLLTSQAGPSPMPLRLFPALSAYRLLLSWTVYRVLLAWGITNRTVRPSALCTLCLRIPQP